MDVYGDGCLLAVSWVIFKVSAGSKSSEGVLGTDKDLCVRVCDCDEVGCPVLLQGPGTQGSHLLLPPLPDLLFRLCPCFCHTPHSSCLLVLAVVSSEPSKEFTPLTLFKGPILCKLYATIYIMLSNCSLLMNSPKLRRVHPFLSLLPPCAKTANGCFLCL